MIKIKQLLILFKIVFGITNLVFVIGFSIYLDNKRRKTYALGDKSGKELIGSIPSRIQTDTEIKIIDNEGNICQIISAVCGSYYTLYIISQKDGKRNLAIVYNQMNDGKPYFLKVKRSPLIALFNGTFQSAAIDSDGGVIFIQK